VIGVALLAYVFISWRIGAGGDNMVALAQQVHPGAPVPALVAFVESGDHSLRDRNRAVWALGQIGSVDALPCLRRNYTGAPCDHTSELCQRELRKAIDLCEGAINVSAVAWRPGDKYDQ